VAARQDELAERAELVHGVLSDAGIWHVLFFGSLLGAVRDGDFIEWDHDIDFLVRHDDRAAIVALNDRLDREHLWFWHGLGAATDLALNPTHLPWYDAAYLSIMHAGGGGELFAPVLFDDGVLRLYDLERDVYHWPQSSFPAWFVEDLDTVCVRGVDYPIPRAADILLGFLYGDDWRTPIRSVRDGGDQRDDRLANGDVGAPTLAAQVAWCEARGWDRGAYADRPAWPRRIRAAGPGGITYGRAAATSGSCWWHTLEELAEHY
jgi:hypothetical protein